MTARNEVYKCNVCGNIVEVLHAGVGKLVCCEQPMKLMTENTTDAAKEKHVPVIEKTAGGFRRESPPRKQPNTEPPHKNIAGHAPARGRHFFFWGGKAGKFFAWADFGGGRGELLFGLF